VKVNGAYYRDIPAIRLLAGDMFVFQQDSARAHATVEYLRQATPDFISPDLWPPSSPDLNPVGYKIWGCLVQDRTVYQKRTCDVNELKERLVYLWSDFGQTIIDKAID